MPEKVLPEEVRSHPRLDSPNAGEELMLIQGNLSHERYWELFFVLSPSAAGALTVSGNATLAIAGAVVVDSGSASALSAGGNATISAAAIDVHGGVTRSGNASLSPAPAAGAAAVPDPLAALPAPSAAGLTHFGAEVLGGNASATIGPGLYTQIQVAGNARLTMMPGLYVIAGGGFVVSGNGGVTGAGVTIYNAGSDAAGATSHPVYGAVTLGGNGVVSLSAATGGPYAGVVVFQSRADARALVLSGNAAAGIAGVLYAPAAAASLAGNARLTNVSLVVATLTVSGNAGAYQLADGAGAAYDSSTSNWIVDPVLTVAVEDDTGAGLDPAEVADIGAAMAYLNQALGPFGVALSWAPAGAAADVTVHIAAATPEGGVADGVLGFTTESDDIYIVAVWSYYTGSDSAGIGPGQYDFTTLATHELAHALGLGESADPDSVMYEYLAPGTARRTLTDANLTAIDSDADRFMKAGGGPVVASGGPVIPACLDPAPPPPSTPTGASPPATAAPGETPAVDRRGYGAAPRPGRSRATSRPTTGALDRALEDWVGLDARTKPGQPLDSPSRKLAAIHSL